MKAFLFSVALFAGFFLSGGTRVIAEELDAFRTYPSCERLHYPFMLDKTVVEAYMQSLMKEHADHSDIYSFSCSRRDRRLATLCHSVRRVGMFDVGSTGIRLLVADIDQVTGHVNKLCSFEYSMPFGLSKEDALARLAAIGAMKRIVEERYDSVHEIEFFAVATAGFRSAGDEGYALARDIKRITGVHFEVIDQDKEGVLAFLGAHFEYPRADASRVVVWDIGGGSMQLTMQKKGAGLYMAGCEVAARTFLQETLSRVKRQPSAKTPHPMTPVEVNQAIELAGALLSGTLEFQSTLMPFSAEDVRCFKERIRSEGYVLGIGGVHARIVLPCVRAITGGKEPSYTPQSLRQTIDHIASQALTDDDINVFLGSSTDHVASTLPSLIMVYAVLDFLEIDRVHVLDINNTQGLVAEYVSNISDR